MKQRLLMSGIPLPKVFNSSGGGIVKAFLTLLLMLTAITASAQLSGGGTAQNPYIIKSSSDWEWFCKHLKDGAYYRLDQDISTGNMVEGTFTGTFDGNGHTINFNISDSWMSGTARIWNYNNYIAPFRNVSGATFKNLRMAGQVATCGQFASSIAGQTSGDKTTYFYDCTSSSTLYWGQKVTRLSEEHPDLYWGAFVGQANAPVVINNCWFNGAIKLEDGTTSYSEIKSVRATNYAGFVGWSAKSAAISNSLLTASISSTGRREGQVRPFALGNGVSITNSYFNPDKIEEYSKFDSRIWQDQGTKISTNDAKQGSGELSWLLQNGQPEMHWGQTLGSEGSPQLTTDGNKRVYRASYRLKGQEVAYNFANQGKAFTVPDNLKSYLCGYDGSAAQSDIVVALLGTSSDGYYLITCKDDWDAFAAYSRDNSTGNFRLTADITEPVTQRAATYDKKRFGGIFDGGGHTLTINLAVRSFFDSPNLAPFVYVENGTIKNLRITGNIVKNSGTAGGFIYTTTGNTTISNCESNVNFTANDIGKNYANTIGGFVGNSYDNITIKNSIFSGSISKRADDPGKLRAAGFISNCRRTAVLENCLQIGTAENYTLDESATFVRVVQVIQPASATYTNCYYKTPITNVTDAGCTQVNDAQLASGEITWLLNKNCDPKAFGQNLGTEKTPRITSDDSKLVYRAIYTYNGQTVQTCYANAGQAFPNPSSDYAFASYNGAGATADMEIQLMKKSADGFILISNKQDWDYFAANYDGTARNYRLTADITDAVSTMVGSQDKPFIGRFDGDGHTLTVNYDVQNQTHVAPFRYINGATINGLRTAGTITANATPGMAGGLVGETNGNASTINDCESAVNLIYTGTGDATHGGFLGRAEGPATFNNCKFTGSMRADNGYCVGGFAGWANKNVAINNCLVAANVKVKPSNQSNNNGNAAFGRNPQQYTVTNSYVLKFDNTEVNQGVYVTQSQLTSGEVAYKLQGSQTTQHWGQTVGSAKDDALPMLTADKNKHVYKADLTLGGNTFLTYYASQGNKFSIPGYWARYYDNQPATADRAITTLTAGNDGFINITVKDEWDALASISNLSGKYRLMADLNDVTTMIPSFSGEFDGNGHTLTVNYTRNGESRVAPFRYVNGATIKSLRTAGTISTNQQAGDAAGLAGEATGNPSTFTNCQSAVAITFTGSGDATNAGFLGRNRADVSFTSCAFTGSISAPQGHSVAGFVGWAEKSVKIDHCLVAANINAIDSRNSTGNAPFARNANNSTVTNSYYVDFANINGGYRRGNVINAAQVSNGAMAYILQNGQSQNYWGQTLGTNNADAKPLLTNADAKHVYKASLKYNGEEKGAGYANKGNAFAMDNVQGYTLLYNNVPADKDIDYQLMLNDRDGYALIHNNDEWNLIVNNYTGNGNFRLAADLQGVNTMIGTTEQNPFKGIFDGALHTLNVDITSSQSFAAPFRFVQGATIKNLNVTGKIHQTGQRDTDCNHSSGLTGRADGVTLERCISSVALKFDIAGDIHSGGLVGHAVRSTININDCAFIGSITEQPGIDTSVGGLIGWGEGDFKANIKNSYVDETLSGITGQNNLVRANKWSPNNGSTFENCYYTLPTESTKDWDAEPATKVTKEQMQNGYVANMLQNGHAEADGLVWGQTLGDNADAHPVITNDANKRVYKASFTFEDNNVASVCANSGKTFPALTSVKYVSADPTDYSSQTASKDITVTLTLFAKDDKGNWLINSTEDWNTFAAYCTKGNYSLGKDISDITTPAASKQNPFTGTFDGQGYTLNVNYDFSAKTDAEQDDAAPFRAINGATIKNVRTAGVIITKKGTSDAAGLVGESTGNVNINNCESAVDITYSGTGDATNAGLIGRINDNSNVTVDNCAFTGSLKSAQGHSFGGLIGWTHDSNVTVAISNSLVAADIEVQNSGNTTGNAPFARNAGKTTVDNCYYRDFKNIYDGYRKGTTVTDEQLKSGEVAYMLQGTTQKTQAWGQVVGTDDMPHVTSETAKRVLKTTYSDNSTVYDNYIVFNEDKGNNSIVEAQSTSKENMKLVRKFAEGWNTLVLPFSLTTDEVNEAFGDETKVAYFTNDTPNTIELNTKTDTKDIDANQPVLIKPSKPVDEIGDLTFSNKEIVFSDGPVIKGANGINFVGSYDANYDVKAGEYFISGTFLWKSEGNTILKATRGYFTVPESAAGAKIMLSIDGDTATGIEEVNGVKNDEGRVKNHNVGVYTLSGQKVADTIDEARKLNIKQGVYIVNGKKVVIK